MTCAVRKAVLDSGPDIQPEVHSHRMAKTTAKGVGSALQSASAGFIDGRPRMTGAALLWDGQNSQKQGRTRPCDERPHSIMTRPGFALTNMLLLPPDRIAPPKLRALRQNEP
jgi:hypothetical protein